MPRFWPMAGSTTYCSSSTMIWLPSSVPVAVRQPTGHHPDAGAACPACEHVYARHEGIPTGRDFVFGHAEIARLLVRVGEGMSLRAASADLRQHVLRSGAGGTSRQANLAVNYLDALAPAMIAALHPTDWPPVVVLDTVTLFSRAYRAADGEPDEARVTALKAGTILVALDGTARGARPCLMQVAGAKDVESWTAFFATLSGAPDVVVADLDAAIARAVRETFPAAILVPSRHHLAAQMRVRQHEDGLGAHAALYTRRPRLSASGASSLTFEMARSTLHRLRRTPGKRHS